MQVVGARIVGMGPLKDVYLPLAGDDGIARNVVVVHGAPGVGKTTIAMALSSTRPGYAIAPPKRRREKTAPFAVVDWQLGEDESGRAHPLRIASPNAMIDESDEILAVRRREQALYERRAAERGFAFCAFPPLRWFSHVPLLLTGGERALGRYDVRAGYPFEDASRADLTRDTKQVLSYCAISASLASHGSGDEGALRIWSALEKAVLPLAALAGFRFVGADANTLEPVFQDNSGTTASFDELPTHARHLVSFAALPFRTLHQAYAAKDPRECEGVVVIDDAEAHLDTRTQAGLIHALRASLPRVQWILTTNSLTFAVRTEGVELLALRRAASSPEVEVAAGIDATIH